MEREGHQQEMEEIEAKEKKKDIKPLSLEDILRLRRKGISNE